jgi:pyruvate/2-oxoglutarate dehydrogenase complex dihydrolipoamide dehydrogenase (E3) component
LRATNATKTGDSKPCTLHIFRAESPITRFGRSLCQFCGKFYQGVTLIERYESLGGVCLNVGCIPSKALLHTAEIINEAAEAQHLGVTFNEPKIDIDAVRKNKDDIVSKLTSGIKALAKARGVQVSVQPR